MSYRRDDGDYYQDDEEDAKSADTKSTAIAADDPNSKESLDALNKSLGFGDFDITTGLNADGTKVEGPDGDPSHHTPTPLKPVDPPPAGGTGGSTPTRGGVTDFTPSGVPSAPSGPAAYVPNPQDGINQKRADDLYEFLMGRAHQSEKIDPNDPIIRAQSDTYSANLTRQGRHYLSELAERKGAGGNISAESRMVSEKNAQAGAGHEGELLQHELDSRRQEIQQALHEGAQFLTSQQQMSLQRELATIENNMKMYQTQLQESQFGRNLDYQNRDLSQRGELARAGMAQSASQFGSSMSQRESEFSRNLGQRAYEYDTDDEFRRSPYAQR